MIKEKLANMLETKKLIAIALSIAFIVQAVRGEISAEQFMNVFTAVIFYYFGQSSTRQAITENKK